MAMKEESSTNWLDRLISRYDWLYRFGEWFSDRWADIVLSVLLFLTAASLGVLVYLLLS